MKKHYSYIALLAALLLASCASELNVHPEGGSASNEQLAELAKKDPDAVLGPMMLGAVAYMHSGSYTTRTDNYSFKVWNLGLDMMGNDMVLTDLKNWFKDQYMMVSYRQQSDYIPALYWYVWYKIVYKSNQILDLIPSDAKSTAMTYKAQALTFRALAYYYLMNLYQDDYLYGGKDKAGVPLYLKVQDALPREASHKVYAQILGDLQTAVALFEQIGYDDNESKTDIDGSVANLVLARVALTIGEYDIAAAAAGKLIGQYPLMDETAYTTSGFQDLSLSEVVWGYKYSDATTLNNRSFASFMSIYADGYGGSANHSYVCIDDRLYNQMAPTDYRRKNFLAQAVTEGTGDDRVTYPKYSNTKFGTPNFYQDEIFMRVSEAYLLKAEAEARSGDDGAAQQTLYDLVSVRDTGYAKSTKTGDDLLNEIFVQSRIELWGEGFEYLTNKRFNVGVDRRTSTNHTDKTVTKAPGKLFTMQIPLTIEITPNPHMTEADQNPL